MSLRGRSASDVEPVKRGDVAARDLEAILGAGALEVALDDLLRMRPGRGLVRVVARPHHGVDTDKARVRPATEIVEKGPPHLAAEILARLQFLGEAGGSA